jgi:membrane associated rhomboid family serine protease
VAFLLSMVVQSSMSTTQAGSLAVSVLTVLCGLLAGYAGWWLTDRLIAWRQDTD